MQTAHRPTPFTDAVEAFVHDPSLHRRRQARIGTQLPPSDDRVRVREDGGSAFDPHSLRDSAPLVYAAYKVAVGNHAKLLSRTITEEAVVAKLRAAAPRSGFRFDYVARQVFKFINPYGHGANGPRFRNEALACFRQAHPEDAHLTAGFILMLCAAKWWTHEQGHRLITPRVKLLGTSDLDAKLQSFGFVASERHAICRLLRRPAR